MWNVWPRALLPAIVPNSCLLDLEAQEKRGIFYRKKATIDNEEEEDEDEPIFKSAKHLSLPLGGSCKILERILNPLVGIQNVC